MLKLIHNNEMIKIIAHRGMWNQPEEKNTIPAFERALQNGFGIETDFRDLNGKLVISHNPPGSYAMTAESFFKLCDGYPDAGPHAINIKADGLQYMLAKHIEQWTIDRYFVFDMSVPDTLGYINAKFNTFSRVSEYEGYQNFDGRVNGVWLDAFTEEWYGPQEVKKYSTNGKQLAIVSSELHGRDYQSLWAMIKTEYTPDMSVLLCTDFPQEAKRYFYE